MKNALPSVQRKLNLKLLRFLQDIFNTETEAFLLANQTKLQLRSSCANIWSSVSEKAATLGTLGSFLLKSSTEVSLYQRCTNWRVQIKVTSDWFLPLGHHWTRTLKVDPSWQKSTCLNSFQHKWTDQPTNLASCTGHSFTKHGFIFWAVIISRQWRFKNRTSLKHPFPIDHWKINKNWNLWSKCFRGKWKQSENNDYDSKQPFKL